MVNPSLEVETSSGVFRGVRYAGPAGTPGASGVRWLGVPYAAAPVGPLRFRAPEPVVPKPGVRDASGYGAASVQPGSVTAPVRRLGPGVDEDCLFLNVYAPAAPGDGGPRPVLVWIHGGAYTGGSAALYDGAHLAALGDIVVVTVNYRLGVLGLVDLGGVVEGLDADSNNGIRDQLAALTWVRDNIAAFGGDPARVTVAGESAGAVSVALLLTTDLGRSLVRGAIVQSGSYSLVHAAETRERIARRYLTELGLGPRDAVALRSLSAGRLLEAQEAVRQAVPGTTPAAPWFDGDLLPASLQDAQQVVAPGVTLLAGSNHDESEMFRLLPGDILPVTREAVAIRLYTELGDDRAEQILTTYPPTRRGDRALTTDFDFAQPTRHLAERHVAAGGAAFVYRFDARVPWWGATHAAELPYLWDWRGIQALALRGPATAARRSLAARLQWAWVRFVRDLEPDPSWPSYEPDARFVRVFDTPGDRTVADPHRRRRVAWDGADVHPTP